MRAGEVEGSAGDTSDVPADPFDGKSLRYKKPFKGFTIYSIGPDRQDNGGIHKPPRVDNGVPYDLAFTVSR